MTKIKLNNKSQMNRQLIQFPFQLNKWINQNKNRTIKTMKKMKNNHNHHKALIKANYDPHEEKNLYEDMYLNLFIYSVTNYIFESFNTKFNLSFLKCKHIRL